MSLFQTMTHNTRANFCAIFLLGVALATLVLLVVAKLTSSNEIFIYDAEQDQNTVITNHDRLYTIELLALGLIIVLLLGSLVYCGVAICDANSELVKVVKHENACFANSSPRRKFLSKSNLGPRRQVLPPGSGRHDKMLMHNDDDHCNHLQEQPTVSMLSSGTEQDDTSEVLISMEEADRYYQALEDQACCSPLSMSPTGGSGTGEDSLQNLPSDQCQQPKYYSPPDKPTNSLLSASQQHNRTKRRRYTVDPPSTTDEQEEEEYSYKRYSEDDCSNDDKEDCTDDFDQDEEYAKSLRQPASATVSSKKKKRDKKKKRGFFFSKKTNNSRKCQQT